MGGGGQAQSRSVCLKNGGEGAGTPLRTMMYIFDQNKDPQFVKQV